MSAAQTNLNQGERTLGFFEQGRVFDLSMTPDRTSTSGLASFFLTRAATQRPDSCASKASSNVSARRLAFPALEWKRGGEPWFAEETGAILETSDGTPVGMAGLVSRDIAARWDLGPDVLIAELDIDTATEPALPRYEALARFPSVVMDMTVEHEEGLNYAELESATRDLAGEWVEDLSYVTRFPLPDESGRVRTTQRLVYRHPDRSLTQEEVNTEHSNLREGLAERLGVTFA